MKLVVRRKLWLFVLLCTCWPAALAQEKQAIKEEIVKEEIFEKVRMAILKADKPKEIDVRLRLTTEGLQIEEPKSGDLIKTIDYATVKALTYERGKQPRKGAVGAAGGAAIATLIGIAAKNAYVVLGGYVAIPIALAAYKHKGSTHWLTIQGTNEYAVFHLNGKNYRVISAALAARSGVKVRYEEGN